MTSRTPIADTELIYKLREAFSGVEEPLSPEWLGLLSEPVRQMAIDAQQCLIENGRDNQVIISAVQQIQEWNRRQPARHKHNEVALILKEDLGVALNFEPLVTLLLSQPLQRNIKKYEYTAIALLMTASKLVVFLNQTIAHGYGQGVQVLTVNIVNFHKGLLLFRKIDNGSAKEQGIASKFAKTILSMHGASGGKGKGKFKKKLAPLIIQIYEARRQEYDGLSATKAAKRIRKFDEVIEFFELHSPDYYDVEHDSAINNSNIIYTIVLAHRKNTKKTK